MKNQLTIDEILGSADNQPKQASMPNDAGFMQNDFDDGLDDDFGAPGAGDFGFGPPLSQQPPQPPKAPSGRRHFGRGAAPAQELSQPQEERIYDDFAMPPPAAQQQPQPPKAPSGRRHFGRGAAPAQELSQPQEERIYDDFAMAPSAAQQQPQPPAAPSGRRHFSHGTAQNAPAQSFSAALDFDDGLDDDFSMPPVVPPVPQQPQRPVVKAVNAPPAEVVSVDGGNSLFGQLKTKLSGRQPEDDGVVYYTPPEGYAPKRIRYRRHNHRPFPMWVKSALLAAGLLFAIFSIVKLTYYGMMIGRSNHVDDTRHASVRLTLDESAAMQAQLSEEITNEVTLPGLAIRSEPNIRTILLVGTSAAVGSGNAGECDSIVIVAIDDVHKKIKLVSVARELYAYIPDYHNNMLGEAYFYDSAAGNRTLAVMRDVIEQNLCIRVDNVAVIDYEALQTIVNKLGGIKMAVSDEEALYMSTDEEYGTFPRYTAGGIYTLTGAEMLNYLRMLNIGEQSDAERVTRLRGVLDTVRTDLGSRSGVKRAAAIYSVLPYITTDIDSYDMYSIITNAKRYCKKYEMCGYSLPVNGSWDYDNVEINGEKTRVVVASYSFNAEYLQKFIYDDDLTYTYGNSVTGVDVPYVSEEAKAAALAEAEAGI